MSPLPHQVKTPSSDQQEAFPHRQNQYGPIGRDASFSNDPDADSITLPSQPQDLEEDVNTDSAATAQQQAVPNNKNSQEGEQQQPDRLSEEKEDSNPKSWWKCVCCGCC